MDIALPTYFRSLLEKKEALFNCVSKSFRDFGPWLEHSGMPFFPGFTDHSPRHINDVLTTASSLISDEARHVLSAEDACILTLAILLHDCGMHVTQDGFRCLIADNSQPVCPSFDKASWQVLWQDFLGEASRFSQQKLESVFGDATPMDVSKFDSENLSERDLLLGGEFVRRHHARLAHEIALRGVPPFQAGNLSLQSVDPEFLDIAGLVARSHNLSIRSSFSYLKEKYEIREYRSIKIPYLMGLLRIADYIQVQSERANTNLLKVKELRSSISIQEWKTHFAVKDVSTRHEDPEAIFVNADPKDAKTYLKLSALFKDIQKELDETWATFGEVYGRFSPLNGLGLTIRRIRSTLDDTEKLSRKLHFLPLKASFKSSDAELLELLIGPLYGYEPSIGIRELIQNAVDACRELTDLKVDIDVTEQRCQEADVCVHLTDKNGQKTLQISDKGTGMTAEVVLNYFLIAGASFRNSEVWKQQHCDIEGRSNVLRGGRFGVGALAAFLIGKKIIVETRHYSMPEDGGIRFECSVADPIIELQKAKLPLGTSICIEVDNAAWLKLAPRNSDIETSPTRTQDKCTNWDAMDWYGLESPSVSIFYTGPRYDYRGSILPDRSREKIVAFEGFRIFSEFQSWKELSDPGDYDRILWSPKPTADEVTAENETPSRRSRWAPSLTVNGIKVGKRDSSFSQDSLDVEADENDGLLVTYQRPPLAIFDPSGICPLNLQRNSINFSDLGIDTRLASELIDNFLQIVEPHIKGSKTTFEFLKHIRRIENNSYLKFVEHSYTYSGNSQVCPFLITASGIRLLDPYILAKTGITSLFLLPMHKVTQSSQFPLIHLNGNEGIVLTKFGDGVAGRLAWFRAAAAYGHYTEWFRPRALKCIKTISSLGIATVDTKKLVTQPGKVRRDMLANLEWFTKDRPEREFFTEAGQRDSHLEQLTRIEAFSNIFEYSGDLSHWILGNLEIITGSILADRWLKAFHKMHENS